MGRPGRRAGQLSSVAVQWKMERSQPARLHPIIEYRDHLPMTTLTIYLVRHATPDWSRTDIPYHIPPGPPLTEQGRAEAEALGAFLHQAGVRQIFTSPLERCHHTAQIAGALAGAPVETLPELGEWSPGETMQAMRERTWPAFEQACLACAETGPVALVTHGGPVLVLLEALGMPPEVSREHRIYDHRNPLPPAGAWLAQRNGQGEAWALELVFTPQAVPAEGR